MVCSSFSGALWSSYLWVCEESLVKHQITIANQAHNMPFVQATRHEPTRGSCFMVLRAVTTLAATSWQRSYARSL